MLRFFVLWNMVKKAGFVGEALVATITFVRLVGLVGSGMRLKVGELREGFRTVRVATFVRLIARVRPNVLLQMRQLCEFALTDFASIRLDAQVNPRVLRQVGGVGERFGALRTLVRFCLSHVHLRM